MLDLSKLLLLGDVILGAVIVRSEIYVELVNTSFVREFYIGGGTYNCLL